MVQEPTLDGLRERAMFIVWGPPGHGPRSRVLARKLGIDIRFITPTRRRGALWAPVKYPYQAAVTLWLLLRRRPALVFVQSPPSFAPLLVVLWCRVAGGAVVVDAHSDAFESPYWSRPERLYRAMARQVRTTIVTNRHHADRIRAWGGRATVLRDIPTDFGVAKPSERADGRFHVMVVSSFASDEPLPAVLEAASELPDVVFHVTGDGRRADPALLASAPANVRFTGFLPDAAYYDLMAGSHAVLCLTTRNHTMQRGACEALSLGVPIITSDWPLLRSYFHKGTVHVDGTAQAVRDGVRTMAREHDRYRLEIGELQQDQQRTWQHAFAALAAALTEPAPRARASAPATTQGVRR